MNKTIILHIGIIFLLVLLTGCSPEKKAEPYLIQKDATAENAMVVSAHPMATKAGLEILKKGGNAIDAAIATELALAVVYQRAGNIGGGGFMVIRMKDGELNTLDFREKAPLAATKDMYLDENGDVVKNLSKDGILSVGVPGTVDGLINAHQKYGKIKDFKTLVEPAIRLAGEGFYLTQAEAELLNEFKKDFDKFNTKKSVFQKEEGHWKMGMKIIQPDLKATLQRIAEKGRAGFYEGETADKIVAQMKTSGGIITHEDLKIYESKWRQPVIATYKGHKIISMPPPSSGGIALVQLLEMAEEYDLGALTFHSAEMMHLIAEIERRVYADRAEFLGDSDFYPVPLEALANKQYLKKRMSDFNKNTVTNSDSVKAGVLLKSESEETTHLSVVDTEGNAVALTTTLNSNFGSKVLVENAGFFLNNEMDDFSAKPGVPNQFGLVGKEANAIQPQKRLLSSMTPTIVEKEGDLFMVLGTPGGSTIITSVFQVFLNVVEYNMNLKDAVDTGRFHHQWLPDKIFIEENGFKQNSIELLTKMGHIVEKRENIGRVDAILKQGKTLTGVGDWRGDDHAEGF